MNTVLLCLILSVPPSSVCRANAETALAYHRTTVGRPAERKESLLRLAVWRGLEAFDLELAVACAEACRVNEARVNWWPGPVRVETKGNQP